MISKHEPMSTRRPLPTSVEFRLSIALMIFAMTGLSCASSGRFEAANQVLLDALGAIESDEVTLAVVDSNSSCLLREPGNDDSKYVVMPMRL